MKIRMLCVILMLCTVLGSSALMPVVALPEAEKEETVVSVEVDGVKAARFLNMLNHNRVYDDAFLNVDDMVNEVVIGLLDLRDETSPDFIAEAYVRDFVLSMYGVEIVDMSEFNLDMPKKDGFIYIVPRGFSEYSHKLIDARVNEDGSYTVNTEVTVSSHDGEEHTYKAVSLLVENPESQFGYNIISSSIIRDFAEI